MKEITAKLLVPTALAAGLVTTVMPAGAQQAPPAAVVLAASSRHRALADTISRLFVRDQAMLTQMSQAKQDSAFRRVYKRYVQRVETERHNANFYDPAVYALWAAAPDSPASVRRYAAFRHATDARVRAIVAEHGWPRRSTVGDEAAAQFFFLFGHADDDNTWRLTQLPTIRRVFRQDHVNPRLYVHLCDRLANVAGQPQRYGSVMGPGDTPGTAKLYWPLVDNVAAADKRRRRLGLPSIEEDLKVFAEGGSIGPYMLPMRKGQHWNIAEVYAKP